MFSVNSGISGVNKLYPVAESIFLFWLFEADIKKFSRNGARGIICFSNNAVSKKEAGFFMKTVENSCENFAVIDQEIVWYGNIHLLGKEKIEDNIMRVKDKKIAAELMELAFQ